MSRRYPLFIRQGRTLTKPFRRRNKADGTVIDFPAFGITEGRLQVRDKAASEGGVVVLDLSTANGGITLGAYDDGTGTLWSGYLFATAASLHALTPWGEGWYDLVLSKPDHSWVKTVFSGPALLVPEYTVVED